MWERDLSHHEQSEALDFRRAQALPRAHITTGGDSRSGELLYIWHSVYCTCFYVFTYIPEHFFSKSADPDTGDVKLPPTVYIFSWFHLVYAFKIVHVNQHGFCSSD